MRMEVLALKQTKDSNASVNVDTKELLAEVISLIYSNSAPHSSHYSTCIVNA